MRLRPSLIAAVLLCQPAFAAPATQEGADRLTRLFGNYLGTVAGVVDVVPEGESYSLTLDFNPLMELGRESGLSGAISPLHLTLTDQDGGKWGVEQDEPFALTVEVPGTMLFDMRMANIRMNGIYDEALKAFERSDSLVEGMSVSQVVSEAPGRESRTSYVIDSTTARSTAVASLSGGVDVSTTSLASGIRETIVAPAPGGMPPFEAEVTIGTYNVSTEGRGVRTDSILALLAWFVQHPSEAAIKSDADGMKQAIGAAIPLWNDVSAIGEMHEIEVTTPFGAGGADRAELAVDLTGIVAEGRFREKISVSGLRLPEDQMPAWVPALLPNDVTLDVAVEGFDLAAPGAILLAEIAPDRAPGPDFEDRLLAALLPDGKVTITFAPGGVEAAEYSVDAEGVLDAGPGRMPEGSATIGVTGIEAVLKALDSAPEEVRSGAVPALMMARGIAKPAGVGRFVWNFEVTAGGQVLVNGIDLSAIAGK